MCSCNRYFYILFLMSHLNINSELKQFKLNKLIQSANLISSETVLNKL